MDIPARSVDRQVLDPSSPFFWRGRPSDQFKVVDHATDANQLLVRVDNTGKMFPLFLPPRALPQKIFVLRNQDAPKLGGPLQ